MSECLEGTDEAAKRRFQKLESKPMDWTSVEEPPEKYGEYLGSTRARPRGWVFQYAAAGWICSADYPVTHWMPLPDAPKG